MICSSRPNLIGPRGGARRSLAYRVVANVGTLSEEVTEAVRMALKVATTGESVVTSAQGSESLGIG